MHIFTDGDRVLTTRVLGADRASDRLRLNDKLDGEALGILVRSGLDKRFPEQCRHWKHESNAVRNTSESRAKAEITNVSVKLRTELPTLQRSLFEAALDEVLRLYP